MGVGIELLGIGVGFVVRLEALDAHERDALQLGGLYVKVAHHEASEVEACHFKHQLVFVQTVGGVGQHEGKVAISFVGELDGLRRVAFGHCAPPAPDVSRVVAAVHQRAALFQPLHDGLCHFGDCLLGVLGDDVLECHHEGVAPAGIQVAHGPHKHHAGMVSATAEVLHVLLVGALHRVVGRCHILLVGTGIERVLEMGAVEGQRLILGVAHHMGQLALGERVDKQLPVIVGRLGVLHASAHQEQVVVYVVHLFCLREL